MKQKTNRKSNIQVEIPERPPKAWDRCHAYVARKRRFCRQQVKKFSYDPINKATSTETDQDEYIPRYCGNHFHLYPNGIPNENKNVNPKKRANENSDEPDRNSKKQKWKRIPCPIDPSHTIYEHMLKKHIRICPKAKLKNEIESQPYFVRDVNKGGYGPNFSNDFICKRVIEKDEKTAGRTLEKSKELAKAVLKVYKILFPTFSSNKENNLSNTNESKMAEEAGIAQLTASQLFNAIPLQDMSKLELNELSKAIFAHKIRTGGPRHVHQQASIIGHLRQKGLLQNTVNIIEMGAGRGCLGLLVAGVTSVIPSTDFSSKPGETIPFNKKLEINAKSNVNLVMVERAPSRFKAESRIRQAKKERNKSSTQSRLSPESQKSASVKEISSTPALYFELENVDFHRIRCDLAHVHLQSAIPSLLSNNESTNIKTTQNSHQSIDSTLSYSKKKTIVIAKHLCGSGTDLALKSLEPIASSLDGCAFATCCHGICNWDDYVGRLCLQDTFSRCCPNLFENSEKESMSFVPRFGREEFDLMRKWTSGCVHTEQDEVKDGDSNVTLESTMNNNKEKEDPRKDGKDKNENPDYSKNISNIVDSLELSCGIKGLGRACQRIIDYGRKMYMIEKLNFANAEIVYYVDEKVTPQNALIIALKNNTVKI